MVGDGSSGQGDDVWGVQLSQDGACGSERKHVVLQDGTDIIERICRDSGTQ